MNFSFYGYTVRATTDDDLPLALAWTPRALDAGFWLDRKEEPRRHNFLVIQESPLFWTMREPIAFFQVEYRWSTQVRLHFQASPAASRKTILRGITKLVPLIEKGLALGGVKHIFFTSKSLGMIAFMEKRLGYRLSKTDGGADGTVMFKEVGLRDAGAETRVGAAMQEPNRANHRQAAERGSK